MKYLIINADDFGYSYGINKGITDAHTKGIVTSTSVMVDEIGAPEAADLAKLENLSVGLHLVIKDIATIDDELARQVERFKSIVGRQPDHIDTHKSQPDANEQVRQALTSYVKTYQTPVRSLGYAKLIKSFFGLNIDGSGTLNEENVSMKAFKSAIDEATDEYNELMCHPGHSDDYLRKASSYNDIREQELKVLVDPEAKAYINQRGLILCDWKQVRQNSF